MANEDLSKLKIDKSKVVISKSQNRKKYYAVAVIAAIVFFGILYASGILAPAVEVEVSNVAQIYPAQTLTLLNASGYVVAQRKAAVASKITGRLISISVEEGNTVKRGDIIARLENEDAVAVKEQAEAHLKAARADLEQANAELQDATIDFNRHKELFESGLVSKHKYDTSGARYKKATAAVAGAGAAINAQTAALRSADVSLEYTLIRAPFDAVVLTKNADVGDIVTPLGAAANAKASVVTIADMSSLLVEVDVSESNLEQVKLSQPCEIQLDAFPDSRFRGEVHMIVPTADRTKATIMIKVKFLDKDIRILPEMSAKVAFLQRQVGPDEIKPRTAINPESMITRGSSKLVFLVRGNRIIETPVTTGEKLGDMIEVSGGIKAGDRIVAKPSNRLKNGARIKIAEK
ncbi:MAG: efflux RND transporter periplasmic adaptor subunit [Thermodesulfovibrionia bacterium]|nr:efflux RND transporter periplasmic adaptor subunit [Thermodesulfovibrionia bacterium]